ncbi:hypothetical protein ACFE04_009939 [Oxalis oulophora]
MAEGMFLMYLVNLEPDGDDVEGQECPSSVLEELLTIAATLFEVTPIAEEAWVSPIHEVRRNLEEGQVLMLEVPCNTFTLVCLSRKGGEGVIVLVSDVVDEGVTLSFSYAGQHGREIFFLLRIWSEGTKRKLQSFDAVLLKRINSNVFRSERANAEGRGINVGGLTPSLRSCVNESFHGNEVSAEWKLCDRAMKIAESEASVALQRVFERDEALAKAMNEFKSLKKKKAKWSKAYMRQGEEAWYLVKSSGQ